MEILRNAGDFPNDRVVEYATIKISISKGKLPNTSTNTARFTERKVKDSLAVNKY